MIFMQTASLFLLKSIIISGLMFLYYWFILRNRKLHSFNRFYLLASVVVSIALPFVNFEWYSVSSLHSKTAVKILEAINSNEVEKIPLVKQSLFISFEMVLAGIYLLISAGMLLVLCGRIYWVYRIKAKNSKNRMEGYDMVYTDINKAPFSFMKTLFWKEGIDPEGRQGKQILRHELIHIKLKHSLDKLFMQLVLVAFWINPVYWLIKKELSMVHEFIADEGAIENSNTELFAEMLLVANYGNILPDIVHPFFYSPIKRRIMMLNNLNKASYSILRKLFVLPLLFSAILLFSFSKKNVVLNRADRKIVMVIDAGHGGEDNGAIAKNGTAEKNMVLKIANKMTQMGEAYNIEVVPTRKGDEYPSLDARAQKANEVHADLFVSIHINSSDENTVKHAPYEVIADGRGTQYTASSVLASAIIGRLNADGKQAEFVKKASGC